MTKTRAVPCPGVRVGDTAASLGKLLAVNARESLSENQLLGRFIGWLSWMLTQDRLTLPYTYLPVSYPEERYAGGS